MLKNLINYISNLHKWQNKPSYNMFKYTISCPGLWELCPIEEDELNCVYAAKSVNKWNVEPNQ